MPTGISFVRHCLRTVGTGFCLPLAALSAFAQTAAPDPTGEWRVANGYATMRLVDCNGEIWGIVASEQRPGGIDEKNPDARLRSRPTLGMPVLLGMKPSARNEWSGDIYNAQDGRTYSAKISLAAPDTLKVQGCVLGFLCGGENWTRVAAPEQTPHRRRRTAANPRPGVHRRRMRVRRPTRRRSRPIRRRLHLRRSVQASSVSRGAPMSAG